MIAEDLGCGKTNSTDREQVECLQNNVAVHDILTMPRRYSIDSPIGPQAVIDHNFLPDTPKMMMVMDLAQLMKQNHYLMQSRKHCLPFMELKDFYGIIVLKMKG